jgi:hypothetical protein
MHGPPCGLIKETSSLQYAGNYGISVRGANAMIKIDYAKIASHKTDKSPGFLAKVRVSEPRR